MHRREDECIEDKSARTDEVHVEAAVAEPAARLAKEAAADGPFQAETCGGNEASGVGVGVSEVEHDTLHTSCPHWLLLQEKSQGRISRVVLVWAAVRHEERKELARHGDGHRYDGEEPEHPDAS